MGDEMQFEIRNRLTGEVTAEQVKRVVAYNPETGVFTYVVRPSRNMRIGDVAGCVNNEGYRHIRVCGRAFKAHRLAWLCIHGVWPDGIIDHINGERDDNRIANLRIATRAQNRANTTKPMGVSYNKQSDKWVARIMHQGRSRFLGYHKTAEAARAIYQKEAELLHGSYFGGK